MIAQVKSKITKAVLSLLKEGMGYRKVALCIALGIVLGIFPVIGTSTLLCTVVALALRLNLPIIQIVNYAVYPLQIVLLAPFFGVGSWLFGGQRELNFATEMIALMQNDPWGSIIRLWNLILYAVGAWMLVSPFIVIISYHALKPVIRNLASNRKLNNAFTK